jgi:hypothetical protein
MPDYTIKIRGIKNILLKENDERLQRLHSLCNLGDRDLIEYFSNELYTVKTQIEFCQTYEDLESFVGSHCRMSLEDWINSL